MSRIIAIIIVATLLTGCAAFDTGTSAVLDLLPNASGNAAWETDTTGNLSSAMTVTALVTPVAVPVITTGTLVATSTQISTVTPITLDSPDAIGTPVATSTPIATGISIAMSRSMTIEAAPATWTATTTWAPAARATATLMPTATATPAKISAEAVSAELARAVPPERDDMRLAIAFKGLDSAALITQPHPVDEPLSVGTRQTFSVPDVVNNTFSEIEADLLSVSNHAYFWFEAGPFGVPPDEAELTSVAATFDEIYEEVTAIFGSERTPGIDGDPRLHVLHASPQTICGVSANGEGDCGTAGFVSSPDLQSAALNPGSNEREMFIMNSRLFGGDYYLGVLAHEFRHMIEFNYDVSDTDWAIEGSAVLATDLVGLPSGGVQRANEFLNNPDQQLNSWTELDKVPYYGQGYLFNRYIYDRLGEDFYHEFATSPLPGLVALDSLADRHNLDLSGNSLWLDWLAALVLHDHSFADKKFDFGVEGLGTAATTSIDSLPAEFTTDVRQYAADYYELPTGPLTISFAGADSVPLLSGQGSRDETFWYAQRANYSNPRLTRQLNLRKTDAATLAYDVYSDIETGYDFAYVSVSTDGGITWLPLEAENMQGLDTADDPSASALSPRFYTGRRQAWRHEVVDLTAYAGQEILLRFEMVTDPILTYGGLAVDNVSVHEIGYFDEGHQEGWTAEGFTLATAFLPQPWNLQLITFPSAGPIVQQIPIAPDGQAALSIAGEASERRPILIVAASAPMTLEPASYTLGLSE